MAPQRGWWSRNWKWVVPTGCLGLLLSCGCLGPLVCGATVFESLRGSGVVVDAVAMVKQSPEVKETLGEPIESSMPRQISIQSNDEEGTARFAIPLQGPKASGTLYGEAYKRGEEWSFTTLRVEVPDHPVINLLGEPPKPAPDTVPFNPKALPDVEPLPEDDAPAPRQPERRPSEKKGQEDIQL